MGRVLKVFEILNNFELDVIFEDIKDVVEFYVDEGGDGNGFLRVEFLNGVGIFYVVFFFFWMDYLKIFNIC